MSDGPQVTPLVTVVVLNWNGSRLLPDCLDTLAKQDLDPALWQAWVADNGSTDDSLELLARDYAHVHVVQTGSNLGFAGGNNVAMRQADTPFVALLNNDAYPEPDWLRRLLALAQAPGNERVAAITSKLLFEPRFLRLEFETPAFETPGDPRELGTQITRIEANGHDVTDEVLWDHGAYGVEQYGARRFRWTQPRGRLMVPLPSGSDPADDIRVVVGAHADRDKPLTLSWSGGSAILDLVAADEDRSFVVPGGTPLVDVINNVGSLMHQPGYAADRGYQEADEGQYDGVEDVFLACGAAVLLRREALDEVGLFDDDFFMYYEDTDLSWRFQAAGWRVLYSPDAVVRHLHSASSGEWSPLFTFHVERNRLLVFTKNAPARFAAWLVFRFMLTTASMLRRSLVQAVRQRRRPTLGPLRLRARVALSYFRLLPGVLLRRRRIRRGAQHSPEALFDRWMLAEKPNQT